MTTEMTKSVFAALRALAFALAGVVAVVLSPCGGQDTEAHAALGLPRLRQEVPSGEAPPLSSAVFAVEPLETALGDPQGARATFQGKARVVAVDAGGTWHRILRGGPSGPSFVSFSVLVSSSTVIRVGGARLGITASPVDGSLQVMEGEPFGEGVQWRPVGLHAPLDLYGGRSLAAMPVLTVRLDPAGGVWDLYFGGRQVADGLKLFPDSAADSSAGKFLVQGGEAGALICGLVQSVENPLFEDANGNGVDDAFERAKKGGLLPRGASPEDRRALAREWREETRLHPPPAWRFDRPLPDRLLRPTGGSASPAP